MEPETRLLQLPDGRDLSYCEFGDPSGTPVFYFHGWPACRLEGLLYAPAAEKKNVRLMAIDRPGFGNSTFQPGRQLLDWPRDVVALADDLGLDRFRLLGHSGGGPYAAACAHQIPDRLIKTTIMAGLSPMEDNRTREGMRRMNQFLLSIGKRCPSLLNLMMSMTRKMASNPDNLIKGLKDLPEVDRRLVEQFLPEVMEVMAGAFVGGTRAATCEGVIYAKPWGFQLAEIQSPVSIWQGSLDVNVPLSNGRIYAEEIAGSTLNLIEGEGHFSMAINQGEAIFETI
ncbi:MAG: alpha/beta hydrolase [Verrucomicrobiales bacterium]|nr:alpha/beta hydrolase [Verrucomicrobiales bacterium]